MKISPKQLDQLIESLVEQAFNSRFPSGDPYKKTDVDKDVVKLNKYMETTGLFFHFSETGKIGINPKSTDHPGVRGFYGFLLTPKEFFQESHHEWFTKRKYIVVFKLKPGLNILKLRDRNDLNNTLKKGQESFQIRKAPLDRHLTSKAEQTRLLQKMNFDGVFSGQQFFMTDMKNELVVFPPYQNKIEIVDIVKNPLHTYKQNREFYDPVHDGPPDETPPVRVPPKYQDSRASKKRSAKNKLQTNKEPKSRSEAEKRRKKLVDDNDREPLG